MSGRVTVGCVTLFLALTSVSAVQKLNSINNLKKISSGQSESEQSLTRLLYWFASTVEMGRNNEIWLTFNPNNHYGSHYYSNYERLLPPPSQGNQYHTVGNINQQSDVELPSYVTDLERNAARIIIEVMKSGGQQRIYHVYITQHYDPRQTYEISTNLLREIREFSVGDNHSHLRNQYAGNINDFQLNDIRNSWGDLAGLGLLLFIVFKGKFLPNKPNRPQNAVRRNTEESDFVSVDIPNVGENGHRQYTDDSCISCTCVIFSVVFLVVFLMLILLYSGR